MSDEQPKSDLPKERIGVIAAVLAVLGTISAFLNGVNWNVIFSPEGAGVASAMVAFIGSGVVLGRAIKTYLEKRNG